MTLSPVVALISPGGYLGAGLLPVFANAVKTGDFATLRLLTSSPLKPGAQIFVDQSDGKITVHLINYEDKTTLEPVFESVDAVVSAMTVKGGAHHKSEQNVIEAAAAKGVKVYLPSEWGYDYDRLPIQGTLFQGKLDHRKAAEALGLKVVAVAVGAFYESFDSPAFGRNGDSWEITDTDTGKKRPFALTAMLDIARYAARVVDIAHAEPEKLPSRVRVYSSLKTIEEYADVYEKIAGTKINRSYVTQAELDKRWEENGSKQPYLILHRWTGTSATDFSDDAHVELLNPGHKYFEPVPVDESFLPKSSL